MAPGLNGRPHPGIRRRPRQEADQTGAPHTLAATPVGGVLLWLLAIGFAGMTAWRLSEAIYGTPGADGRKAASRVAALGRAVIAGVITYGVMTFALGGQPPVQ